MKRSQEEIENEWEKAARNLFDNLRQDHNNECTLKDIFKERKTVQNMVMSSLIETGDDKYLSLIFEIVKSTYNHNNLVSLFSVGNYDLETVRGYWNDLYTQVQKNRNIDSKSYEIINALAVILHCPTLISEKKSILKNLLNIESDKTEESISMSFVIEAKILGFPELNNWFWETGNILIKSKNQDDRLVGLYMLLASERTDFIDILDRMKINDRAEAVKEFAAEAKQILSDKVNIREYWTKNIWNEAAGYYENEKWKHVEIPQRLIEFAISNVEHFDVDNASITQELATVKSDISSELLDIAREKDDEHTKIQALLCKIGIIQSYKVHVARNDRNKIWRDLELSDLSITQLPPLGGLNDDVIKTMSLIDLVWFRDKDIIERAIEIEHSSTIYSGLLRLSDLAISIGSFTFALSIVLPEKRVDKLKKELERPSFKDLKKEGITYCTYEEIEESYNNVKKLLDNKPNMIIKDILPWEKVE